MSQVQPGGTRRRAASPLPPSEPAAALPEASPPDAEDAVEKPLFDHALRLPPQWQSASLEPWIEWSRLTMEWWSAWVNATVELQRGMHQMLGTPLMPAVAPETLLNPWALTPYRPLMPTTPGASSGSPG